MADLDSLDKDLESLFDDPAPEDSVPAAPDSRIGALVDEFLALDRRQIHGDPALDPAEARRLDEVRELLEYELGSGSPPLQQTRRASLRVPTQLKALVGSAGEKVANVCSLSRGGAFVELTDPPAAGSRLDLAFERGAGARPLRITATVIWVREIANMDGPSGVGVAFAGMEDDDFTALERLLVDELHSRARAGA